MSAEERQAIDDIVTRMEKSYRTLLKIAYGLATALIGGLLFYFINFGEVKANSTYAKDGVIRIEATLQNKVDRVEFIPLRADISAVKTSTSKIEGLMEEHLRNDR